VQLISFLINVDKAKKEIASFHRELYFSGIVLISNFFYSSFVLPKGVMLSGATHSTFDNF